MANRETSNFRQITQQVVENPDQTLAEVAQIGSDFIKTSQQAKVTENLSQAQLELNQLNNQFKIDYQGDPTSKEGIQAYQTQRQAIFDKYKPSFSLYGRDYLEGTQKLAQTSDLSLQGWGFQQAEKNAIISLDNTIQNQYELAAQNGIEYANGNADEISSVLDFANSRRELEQFGNKSLGEVATQQLLKEYEADYMVNFLSGMASEDIYKAEEILNSGEFDDVLGFERKQKLEAQFGKAIKAQQKRLQTNTNKALKLRSTDPYTYFAQQGVTSLEDNVAAQSLLTGNPSAASVMGNQQAKALVSQFSQVNDINQFQNLYESLESEYQDYMPNALNDLSRAGLNNNARIAMSLMQQPSSIANTNTMAALFDMANMKDVSGKSVNVQTAATDYLATRKSSETIDDIEAKALQLTADWQEVQISGKSNPGDIQFMTNTVKDLTAYYITQGYGSDEAVKRATEWLTDGSEILDTNGHKYMIPTTIGGVDEFFEAPIKDKIESRLESLSESEVFYPDQTVGGSLSKNQYVDTIKSEGGWINSRDGKRLLLVDGDGLFVLNTNGQNISIDLDELQIEANKQMLEGMTLQEKIDYYGEAVEQFKRGLDGNP